MFTIRQAQLEQFGGERCIQRCPGSQTEQAIAAQQRIVAERSFAAYVAYFQGDMAQARAEFLRQPGLPQAVLREVADARQDLHPNA